MRLVEYARSRPMTTALAAGLVVGTVLGLAQPIRASAPDLAELTAWERHDAAALTRYDEAVFARVRDRALWGDAAGGGRPGAPAKVTWRLAGIMSDPVPTAIVFVEGQANAVHARVGDDLPDGAQVKDIDDRAVFYLRGGCEYEKALYSSAELPAEDCAGPP